MPPLGAMCPPYPNCAQEAAHDFESVAFGPHR